MYCLTPELSRAAKRRRLGRIVRHHAEICHGVQPSHPSPEIGSKPRLRQTSPHPYPAGDQRPPGALDPCGRGAARAQRLAPSPLPPGFQNCGSRTGNTSASRRQHGTPQARERHSRRHTGTRSFLGCSGIPLAMSFPLMPNEQGKRLAEGQSA